jgi:hypothetical protein
MWCVIDGRYLAILFRTMEGRSVGRNFLLHEEADGGSDRMSHEVIVLLFFFLVVGDMYCSVLMFQYYSVFRGPGCATG